MALRLVPLLVLAALLAILAGRDARLAYWRSQAPSLVPQAIAADPMIKLRDFEQFVSRSDQFSIRASSIAGNAMNALRAEPLNAVAMRQLGMVAAAARADAGRQHLMAAERISRRDITTQFLLIAQTAKDDDAAATLSHYDRVLLVYSAASQQLYPALAQALPDLDVRAALAKYAGRAWAGEFLANAIELGGDPASVTELMADLETQLPPQEAVRITAAVINQLLARRHYSLASDFVRNATGGDPSKIDEIAMSAATNDARLSGLAWSFTNDDAIETVLEADGRLAIRVSSDRSGKVAERITLLAPGMYAFTQVADYDTGSPHAKLLWAVRCQGDASANVIWQQSLPIVPGQTTYRSAFTVPDDCLAQGWQLLATADETQFASTASISSLALTRQ